MAIVRAVKSGNWSDPTVWNTGALPTSADDVYSNTFSVTIDVSPTVLSISNASATGVTAGGGFTISANGVTLTCTTTNGIVSGTAGVTCLSVTMVSGFSCNINSNAISGGASGSHAITFSGAGTLTIVGNITGSSGGFPSIGLIINGSGTANVIGNVVTGNGVGGRGISLAGNGTLNVTGNVTGGTNSQSQGIHSTSSGNVNITGNVTGGSGGSNTYGVEFSGSGVLTITGTITGGSGGGSAPNCGVCNNGTSGTLVHIGAAQASSTTAAIGGLLNLSSPHLQINILTGPLVTDPAGVNPVTAARWFPADTALSTFSYQLRGQNLVGGARPARNLYFSWNAAIGNYPATSNVRSGTQYGDQNILTGTCAVPPAGSVALGVPVDNTTGTAVLTQANFQAALIAQGLTSARAANLDNLDTTVSSRLASASYQAPLDASGTRTAIGLASANLDTQFTNIPANVRTNLTTELGRIDATVSSRLAAASYQAPLDASGTRAAIGLASANLDTQLDSLPTAAENAQAVRTELTTELGRIDTTVSSRLATTGYTTPPTVGDIATAVWNAATSALSNLGSIGKLLVDNINASISSRLASASYQAPLDASGTRAAVGLATANLDTQLAPLPNLDTTVSSRLASASYQAPLDASGTRAAIGLATANLDTQFTNIPANVRTNLTTELGRIDATVSSRSTFDPALDVVAHVTLVDTTTDLTNPPVVPTPEQIATAVRTELSPELDLIDVATSTRLAAADYQQPPTPEQNAEAVRTELAPELDRLSNCATVDTTGQQIQNALSI